MRWRNTLVWVGAVVAAIVIAGASALYWTEPGFLWRSTASAPVVASAPAEPKSQSIPPAPPPVQAPPPVASAAEPDHAAPTASSPSEPSFDVVNVDPSGEAVIAGRAGPNEKVELRDAGKTVAEATADAAGQFVIMPPALAPGDHSLSLATGGDKAQAATSKTVAVSVATQAKTAVAADQPDAKTTVAAAVPANPNAEPSALGMRILATPATVSGARVAIRSVEAEAPDGLVAKGSAQANTTLRLYLNQADIAEATTQSDGRWSLTIKSGISPGGYVIQADEINPGGATVVASANTPFEYPEPLAAAPSSVAPIAAYATAPPSPSASPADPVVVSVQTKRVAAGHTLWALSQSYYGDPTRYPAIVEANRAQIRNPNLIYPGEVFVVPKSDAKP